MIPLIDWVGILEQALQKVLDAVGVVGGIIGKLIELIFQPILDALVQAVGLIMSTIGTFWIYVKTPTIGSMDSGNPANGTVNWVWEHTNYITLTVAALGLIFGCIQMAWSQRGESARELLRALITLAVASAFVIAVAQALINFGDEFSNCLITTALAHGDQGWTCHAWNEVHPGDSLDFGKAMVTLLGFTAAATGPLGIGLAICIGILVIIAGLIQIVLMVVRTAMLILLLGVLPISAAATNTEMGRNWFKKILAWIFAFILYKPVAAIVYATAIRLTTNNGDLSFDANDIGNQIMNMVTGVTMLVLALFALPALMRFIVPMVAATAGTAGAGMIAARMVGMDKLGDLANKSAEQGSDTGDGDGPSGAQNVGKAPQQAPSSGSPGAQGAEGAQGAPGAEGAAAGGEGAAAGGAAGGGGAAAAGGGAAAAAGPAAAVAAPIVAVKMGMDATKAFGNMAASETMGEGDAGGGGGGGPSGSASGGDPGRSSGPPPQNDPGPRGSNDDGGNQPPPPAPDGPSGSG